MVFLEAPGKNIEDDGDDHRDHVHPGRDIHLRLVPAHGGIMEIQQLFDLVEENQEKNVDDMKASGATHCVFNCPFCFFILAEKVGKSGIVPIMMSDLCLQALGE